MKVGISCKADRTFPRPLLIRFPQAIHFILHTSSFILSLKVVHRQHDDASRPGKNLLRIRPAILVAGQPGHVAGAAIGQPLPELSSMRRSDASGDAAQVEAKFLSKRDKRGFHASEFHEKARRASAISARAVSSWASVVVSSVNCATAW